MLGGRSGRGIGKMSAIAATLVATVKLRRSDEPSFHHSFCGHLGADRADLDDAGAELPVFEKGGPAGVHGVPRKPHVSDVLGCWSADAGGAW